MTVARGKWDVKAEAERSDSAQCGSARRSLRECTHAGSRCAPTRPPEAYLLAAFLAHLASVFRNGYAFCGASTVPVSEVLNGTMRP